METKQLQYIGSDPGAVTHGNFINYYTFHSAKPRVDNLNPQMFDKEIGDPIVCLDIGCNTGELSKELISYIKQLYPNRECYFLAIDIDPVLVNRAKESYNINEPTITFQVMDIMTANGQKNIKEYLSGYGKNKFDITFCFSVTMWIHLNNGDDGLQEFLQFIKEISKTILIESQPWHCYRNAQRRLKKSGNHFPLYSSLKIRNNVDMHIETVLADSLHIKKFESPASSWQRKIISYNII